MKVNMLIQRDKLYRDLASEGWIFHDRTANFPILYLQNYWTERLSVYTEYRGGEDAMYSSANLRFYYLFQAYISKSI